MERNVERPGPATVEETGRDSLFGGRGAGCIEVSSQAMDDQAMDDQAMDDQAMDDQAMDGTGHLGFAPTEASFFHVVRALERLTPDACQVGLSGPPSLERIRFAHDASLVFPTGDVSGLTVEAVDPTGDGPGQSRFVLKTTFLGLSGAISPLPLYFAEEMQGEDESGAIRRDFLDLFHHRAVSLLYRWVSNYSPFVFTDAVKENPWAKRVLALAGLETWLAGSPAGDAGAGTAPTSDPLAWGVTASQLIRLVPLMSGRGRGRRRLEKALEIVLGKVLSQPNSVCVRELAGDWVDLDVNQRLRLGSGNHALGVQTILGGRIYDPGERFVVQLGPVSRAVGESLQPGGPAARLVDQVVTACVCEPLAYELDVLVDGDLNRDLVLSALAGRGAALGRARLGVRPAR